MTRRCFWLHLLLACGRFGDATLSIEKRKTYIRATQAVDIGNSTAPYFASNTAINDVSPYGHSPEGTLTGERKQWHKLTLGFDGFETSETQTTDNPFTNYRLDVNFTHDTGDFFVVPGFYAGDGNAANTGASAGNVWLCHFSPSLLGVWRWKATFITGENVSITNDGTTASYFDGATGVFNVSASDKEGSDLRRMGRLEYVGEPYLRFAGNRQFFLKSGVASPENILAYKDFDHGTTLNSTGWKTWAKHERDFLPGDPTWGSGKGTGLIGAINYLSDIGINALAIQTLTLLGKDERIYPFVSHGLESFLSYDVSKLAQWEVVFEHANNKGIHLQIVTQDQENDQLLNRGSLGVDRAVYYRELVARFGHHLALTWNLGEENTNSDGERKAYSDYFRTIDPYSHPISIHASSTGKKSTFLRLLNYSSLDGISLQSRPDFAFSETLEWVQASRATGRVWTVYNDEQNPNSLGVLPDSEDADHDVIRKNFLWGNLMAGGAGIEYFFGLNTINSDLTCDDFRSREVMYKQSRYAMGFITSGPSLDTLVNVNEMIDADNWAMADRAKTTFLLYLPAGGSPVIDLSSSSGYSFSVRWYNPREGGKFVNGTIASVIRQSNVSIGEPPHDKEKDWAVSVSCVSCSLSSTISPTAQSKISTTPSFAPMLAPYVPLTGAPTMATLAPMLVPYVPLTGVPTMAPFIPLTRAPTSLLTNTRGKRKLEYTERSSVDVKLAKRVHRLDRQQEPQKLS